MLGDIDEGDRQIARCVQNRQAERADQHDIAGGGTAALPECDGPYQQRNGQHDRDNGMGDPELLEITKTSSARTQLATDSRVETVKLVIDSAESPDQRHVVDDIDHFAIDRRRLVGEIVVQGLARRRHSEHRGDHDTGHQR